ncbi:MAG: twin-arginine translocase TatA/TatE family subunit [Acidimicrobiia bacterium]
MFKQIGAGEIILIVTVLLLFFGARKLPDLARSIGKSARELRKGLTGEGEEDEDKEGADAEADTDTGAEAEAD